MRKKGKYKLSNEKNRISVVLIENIEKIKNKLFRRNRAFNMLKKGTNPNESVIGSKIPRSIK